MCYSGKLLGRTDVLWWYIEGEDRTDVLWWYIEGEDRCVMVIY